MSINVNSAQASDGLLLVPMFIPGWRTPVQPAGLAHGGIPLSIYQAPNGLALVIDPPTMLKTFTLDAFDTVEVWVNGKATSVSKVILPGEEQLRILLYLPLGRLVNGINQLFYRVTRPSGNFEDSTPVLDVLYHDPAPGNPAPAGITIVFPPNIVANGVGPADAATGVLATFIISFARPYDEIRLDVGTWSTTIKVTDPAKAITLTLTAADFQQIGDNAKMPVKCTVTDQLGNGNQSATTYLDIHANRLDLLAPTVKGQTGNNLNPTLQDVVTVVPLGSLLPTDKVTVSWQGATGTPAAGSFTSPQRLVSAGREFVVPRSVLAYSLGKTVTVTYVIERNGITSTSLPLSLNILPLPKTALIPPKIVEVDANNVLDLMALGTKDATLHGLLWTLIEAGQQVRMRLEGKKADGTAHNLQVWSGGTSKVNATWVSQGFWPYTLANSYLKLLGHGSTLTIKFKASLDKSNVEATAVVFPDRTYTIKSVELVVPTLSNVTDAGNKEVPEGGLTASITLKLKGTASKGQPVEIFDGSGPSAVSKGTATANATTGIWEHTITVPEGGRRLYAQSRYHPTPVYSNVRNLTVVAVIVPTLVNVLDANNVEVPEGTSTIKTTLKLKGKASNGQQVEIFDGSGSSAVSKGTATAHATTGIWEHTITVAQGGHRLYAKSLYHPTATYSNVRNLTVVATKPSITALTDSKGPVAHNGTTYDTEVTVTVAADPNQSIQLYDGAKAIGAPIPLDSKGSGTTKLSALEQKVFSLTARAVYGNQLESPARIFTRKAHLAVTLTSVKHSRGELGEGQSTASASVTLEGSVTPFYSVQIHHNNSAKNIVQSNASGFWTTPLPIVTGLNRVYATAVATGLNSNSRSFTRVVPSTSENFDQYSTRHVSPGLNIPLNSMTIYHLGGTGFIGIAPLADLFTGPYPQIPGKSYGQTLEMHWKGLGTSQHMRIRFNWGYSSVSFFVRFAQTRNLWIRFLDINNNTIHQHTLPLNFDAQLVSYSHPSIDIWGVEVQTSEMDLVSIDYFNMTYR
ncbi:MULTISPECIES: hypothetical protein [Pseudomonas]|uniref:Uncharacterized protein n=1 Tax=Pseudomonas umsongensis TaxID=198618 RepID=A0ACC5M7C0_9PSED|nr:MULTISPECIES: hypothetical protein [Pseudomonas]MBB2884607.1 hypothetical protein [Pseudomonas umsongensis]NMN79175.1 hypothetical protein [Pseudomonas sp. KD5]CAH0288417.1 hypothetical protein SRABI123_04147 [Pseudomonas sp. Bi123]